jgi:hypothetical protein
MGGLTVGKLLRFKISGVKICSPILRVLAAMVALQLAFVRARRAVKILKVWAWKWLYGNYCGTGNLGPGSECREVPCSLAYSTYIYLTLVCLGSWPSHPRYSPVRL